MAQADKNDRFDQDSNSQPFLELFEQLIEGVRHRALSELIANKLEEQGITVCESDRAEIEEAIQNEQRSFRLKSDAHNGSGEPISLSFSETDRKWLIDQLERATKKLEDDSVFESIINSMVEGTLKRFYTEKANMTSEKTADMRLFRQEVYDCWKEPIEYLHLMDVVFFEGGQAAVAHIDSEINMGKTENTAAIALSAQFHARGCQLFKEILELITSGFPEAALARWRTLHELNVVAHFIIDKGGDTAERYLLYETVEEYQSAKRYDQCYEALGYEPLEEGLLDRLRADVSDLENRFGSGFKKAYGWAAGVIDKNRISFLDIEEAAGFEKTRAHYSFASHSIHATTKGTLHRLSQPQNQDGLIAGPSVWGLDEPITCTAVTVAQLFAILSTQWDSIDGIVTTSMLQELMKKVNDSLDGAGPL